MAGLLGLLATAHAAAAQAPGSAGDSAAVAHVDGVPITADELDSRIVSQLRALEDAAYQARRRALDALIVQKLIEQAAARQNLTPQELQAAVDKGVVVSKEQVDKFVEERGASLPGFSETQLRAYAEDLLRDDAIAAARQNFIERLKSDARIDISLSRPVAISAVTLKAHDVGRGPKDAPVTIVEFGDFECPYCKNAVAALQKVLAKWGDSVRFVYVNFPLESHKNAFKAAEASLCAADQGRFWDYHDRLFAAKNLGAPGEYGAIAESLGLNQRTFVECLQSNTKKALVEEQLERGLKAGVDVTPTFFINGQVVRGAAPFAEFDLAIQQLLGKTKGP